MGLIQKNWVRIILSLFAGGLTAELIHITTGEPNRPMESNLSILYAVVIYIMITVLVRVKNKS
jgi:hypothetical protein